MTLHESLSSLDAAPELREFHAQPAQMRAAASGKIGELQLGFSLKNGRHILHDLYRVAPLLVQQALYWDEEMPELPICAIISVGGGILQGDRYKIDIVVEEGACAHVTSQGANRIHRMDANYASQYQKVIVKSGAYCEYLPDVTIPYRGSRYISQSDLIVAEDATLIFSETIMSGRKHHNEDERFGLDVLSMTTHLRRPCGKKLFAEKILIEKDNQTFDYSAVMKDYDVFANVLCVTPPQTAAAIQARFDNNFDMDGEREAVCSVSRLPNDSGLMLRVVARESYHARHEIRRFWQIVREEAWGKTLPAEFLWR